MSTITVIDNKHVVMYYHTDTKIVHHIYQPTIDGKHVREQLMRGVELLAQYGAEKWLSDNHLFNDLPEEDTKWINDVWIGKAVKAGWKYWAVVVPEADMGRMNMMEFVEVFGNMGVRVLAFTDPDEAMEWLVNIDK